MKPKILRMLAALLAGIGLVLGAATSTSSVAAEAVPTAWLAYVQLVTHSLNSWLSGQEEAARSLRAYLHAMRTEADAPPVRLNVKIWMNGRGVITRIDFPAFVHEQANTDLRALLVGRALPSAPPEGMPLPLRLELQLDDSTARGEIAQANGARVIL